MEYVKKFIEEVEEQDSADYARDLLHDAIEEVFEKLEKGGLRVCEKKDGEWIVHRWIKKTIQLALSHGTFDIMDIFITKWYDKIPLRFRSWENSDFVNAQFRIAPGAIIRRGAFIAPRCVIMPCFINLGAYIGKATMIDSMCSIGSCVQVGDNCHISSGVCIGGVLEPLQSMPTIVEDNCFIGAQSAIVEGVKVEEGSVISMGVNIGMSTKIINRETGEIYKGFVPPYSVVVPGSLPSKDPLKPSLACAVIVKTVDKKTRAKTKINELLRNL
ncbi:MAG: 2,3,4,5-tetrahydropyridine-2,6-dicarboxylate N-succinyltransferase [Alphaproteobacteria bacterium]